MKKLNKLEIRTLGAMLCGAVAWVIVIRLDHRISGMCREYLTGQPYVVMRAMGSIGIILALIANWNRFLNKRWGVTEQSGSCAGRTVCDIKLNVAGVLVAVVVAALLGSYLDKLIHDEYPTCWDAYAWPIVALKALCVGGIATSLMLIWNDVADRLRKRAGRSKGTVE